MKTEHKIIIGDSRKLKEVASNSVDLVITSPPYPMIQMWDAMFGDQNKKISAYLEKGAGLEAFGLMHLELDKVWDEMHRTLKDGGFLCINIGDATRSIGGKFQLFSNHSRIVSYCSKIGFDILPDILWRKQTNAPNKFMGSGMLPAGAYVTLEHEFILIFRKNGKKDFNSEEATIRRESAYFWEERNVWFSDIWEGLKGTGQAMKKGSGVRNRSGAFPFELAYRLVNMFSIKGSVVLDPFLGTGTTSMAVAVSGRNSIGVEIDDNFKEIIHSNFDDIINFGNKYINKRIENHLTFIEKRMADKKNVAYVNEQHNFPIMTRQELNIKFDYLEEIIVNDNTISIVYK